MAESRLKAATGAEQMPDEPVLRQGRAADPVPAPIMSPSPATSQAVSTVAPPPAKDPTVAAQGAEPPLGDADRGDQAPAQPATATSPAAPESGQDEPEQEESPAAIEKALAETRQRTLRLMLKQCDRVLLMDFDLLAMSGWPDNYSLAAARRNRDLWLFSALVAALVFLSGLTGFIPAWIAGGGFGAFVIILMLGVPAIRRIYTARPSYLDLVIKRQRLLRDARKHIEHLEGKEGLVWQCARMAEFNTSLRSSRFSELLALSEQRALVRNMTRREYIRLYLIYLLEAEKAYDRVQKAFFDGNQQAMDRGWASVAASPGQRA
jgi:hypothetical protein